jgi:hypothetical protein
MTTRCYWRQAGTTGRAHLVQQLDYRPVPSGPVCGSYAAPISECGTVRDAAWAPVTSTSQRCGLCRRIEKLRKKAPSRFTRHSTSRHRSRGHNSQ